jgi:DNA-binding IclR family transcriptional regulator
VLEVALCAGRPCGIPALVEGEVRAQGYGVDDEENSIGVRCLAAPVHKAMGGVEAAVGVSGTVAMVNAATMPKYIQAVKDAARRISAKLGYSAHSPGSHRA